LPYATCVGDALAGGRSPPEPDIPYVAPTLKAVFLDAIAPASFLEFLKLGIPGGLMMQLEGNSYDITNVLASLLGMSCLASVTITNVHPCLLVGSIQASP
jgi:hypothetical protein